MRKVYISGPIVGNMKAINPDTVAENKERFNVAEEFFRQWYSGWVVVNPLNVAACNDTSCVGPRQLDHTWDCFLRFDLIAMIRRCDTIAMLPGWRGSKGAQLELYVAQKLDFSVRFFNADITDLLRKDHAS